MRRPYDPATDWTREAAEAIAPFLKTTAEAKSLMERVSKEKHDGSYPPVNYITVILHAWADMDEAGALAAAASYPGGDTDSLKVQLTHYIMRGRPQTEATADEWLQRLPEERRLQGMREIVKGLLSADMTATGRWLLKQDPAISQDSIRRYLEVMMYRNPAAALDYAQTLPDPVQDDAAITRLVARWAVDSPAAVTDLLTSHGWSESRISQLKDRMAVQNPGAVQWWWDW
jgi:hypothetical protein